MKKTIAVGAALLLTLSACSLEEDTPRSAVGATSSASSTYGTNDEPSTYTSLTEPKVPSKSIADERVDEMIEILSVFPEKPDRRDFLMDFANTTCAGLREGVSLEQQVFMSMDYDFGYSQRTMGGIFAAAIMTHCPSYEYQVDEFREKY